ncbi:hypothetical protein NDU88_000561 [Pleurodeles waltl]|uniref:Uncharacterized protein n=1 Tax=Pleurodeles waltl TaxID=8319 RepID=A0AAV7VXA7_PLEWA|nr:hypothetical protein NDU88_000561 [Pleurodeles waltl]
MTREYEDGGLEMLRLDLYHCAAHLQQATKWFDDGYNWEKRLLAGLIAADQLPTMLMERAGVDRDRPYVVRQTVKIWHCFVEATQKRVTFQRELPIWMLRVIRNMMDNMGFQAWREGGCALLDQGTTCTIQGSQRWPK